MTELTKLYKQFTDHYGPEGYKFGYRDRDLYYSFSVIDQRSGRANMDKVELGLPIDEYKKTWWRLMKDFEHGKTV